MARKVGIISSILGITLIVIGIFILLVEMYIQSQCCQLEPNEFYSSTICEKYWKDTNWDLLSKWKNK